MEISSPDWNRELEKFIQLRSRTFYPKTDLEAGAGLSPAHLSRKEALFQSLSSSLPGLIAAATGKKTSSLEPLSNVGTFHLICRSTLEDGSIVYLRIAITTNRPAFEFFIEEQLSPLLSTRGIPAPTVICSDFSRAQIPFDFQVVAAADGVRLTEIENPETQFIPNEILHSLGKTIAALHQIKASGAGFLNPQTLTLEEAIPQGVLPNWPDYIYLNLESHLRQCESIRAITSAERNFISSLFQSSAEILQNRPISLLHGDLGHHNIFVRDSEVAAIIDWEDALAGDPIFDIAYWGTFVRDHLTAPFLEGYRQVSPLPSNFEHLYWLYYLRVSLSKTVHRSLFGFTERPGRPPASQRIQKALHHLNK